MSEYEFSVSSAMYRLVLSRSLPRPSGLHLPLSIDSNQVKLLFFDDYRKYSNVSYSLCDFHTADGINAFIDSQRKKRVKTFVFPIVVVHENGTDELTLSSSRYNEDVASLSKDFCGLAIVDSVSFRRYVAPYVSTDEQFCRSACSFISHWLHLVSDIANNDTFDYALYRYDTERKSYLPFDACTGFFRDKNGVLCDNIIDCLSDRLGRDDSLRKTIESGKITV